MAEQRLIDADALSDKVAESKHSNPHQQGMVRVNHRNEHDHFLRMICEAPTVDAVEVVRCKDCEMWDDDPDTYGKSDGPKGKCMKTFEIMECDGFCSYGERRTDD